MEEAAEKERKWKKVEKGEEADGEERKGGKEEKKKHSMLRLALTGVAAFNSFSMEGNRRSVVQFIPDVKSSIQDLTSTLANFSQHST